MPLPVRDKLKLQLTAGGGAGGNKPIQPRTQDDWVPGMPCHWTEQSAFTYRKNIFVRAAAAINLCAGVTYVVYRSVYTIGRITVHWALISYQIFFLVLEVVSVLSIGFRLIELWNVIGRNSVDFKRIPNDMLQTKFTHGTRSSVPREYSNYPTVTIFIPCYNESCDLVLDTVKSAAAVDYPKELLLVCLCDDGRDVDKREMIETLRPTHPNVFYLTRPDNDHAKAGNLNYAIQQHTADLIVTLDADFISRPHLLQRMMSYFYVWNPSTGMYEFNETLAVVQSPQHFRNLSPHDSDPLDQRSTFFFDYVLPAKDFYNASTMIGTTNLISRIPLEEANYYPTHAVTEDTAMSLAFHSLGYRTYYLNESLATGLATTSLWSNLRQRARWLKGDYQILFSKKGPLTAKGLSIVQRLLYLHMSYSRIVSITHFVYEVALVLLLVFSISPLDATRPLSFIVFLGFYLLSGMLLRFVVTFGGTGLDKSDSGSLAFEAIFRYTCVKSIITTIFKGKKVKFKVTDKSDTRSSARPDASKPYETPRLHTEIDVESTVATSDSDSLKLDSDSIEQLKIMRRSSSVSGESYKRKWYFQQDEDERNARRQEIMKNLKRVWFNILSFIVLSFAIILSILRPPSPITGRSDLKSELIEVSRQSALLEISMAIGFSAISLLPHLVAIVLCFLPYTMQWELKDLKNGRCDQYATHPSTGELYVPWSYISVLGWVKMVIMAGSLAALGVFVFSGQMTRF